MMSKKVIVGVMFFVLLGIILTPPKWLLTGVLPPLVCPGAVYDVKTAEPVVALTIDDGPDLRPRSANSTAAILEVFDEHNQQYPESTAHATFFLIGNQVKQQAAASSSNLDPLTTQILQAGHEVGNHMAQDAASILLAGKFSQVFEATHRQLTRYARLPGSRYPEVRWLRPGVGWCDSPMMKAVARHKAYARAGITHVVLGTIWPYDTVQSWPWFSKWFIRRNVHPGAIIVLHDQGPRGDRTVKVLEGLLTDLTNRGYRIVPLSDLLTYGPPIAPSHRLPEPLEALRRSVVIKLETARLKKRPATGSP